ncbi:MAG: ATP-binding protein [Pseudomonadota bacterium]
MLKSRAKRQLVWLNSGLFWRTFFLLGVLIAMSMTAWIASFSFVERTPRAQQIAAQIISVVTITRAALTHSAPEMRRELLFDLASNEGIRIYPLENSDVIEPTPDFDGLPVLQDTVKAKLGADTQFAGKVNGVRGFWVSFSIEEDQYWLMLERDRVEKVSGLQWLGWAGVVMILSLLGAFFISRLINLPLARLTSTARAIAKGQKPEPLPENGPTEIIEANRSFNQMVDDLNRVETDRAVILAGISHDLRTPLARMQLEVEMAHLSDDARQGMQSDIGQMDAIIGQFLDYAKPTDSASFTLVDLSILLADSAHQAARMPDVRLNAKIQDNIAVSGNAIDLKRVINNLIENTRRYGKTIDTDMADIALACYSETSSGVAHAVIEITDHGIGVPESEMERLLQPFSRMDTARGQANGAGLGLAIVNRVVQRHGGALQLSNRVGGGLSVKIKLPLVKSETSLASLSSLFSPESTMP